MKRKKRQGTGNVRTATMQLDCVRCQGAILKGWTYRRTPSGKAEHYNATHWPACHNPRDCVACLKPGRKLLGANYAAADS